MKELPPIRTREEWQAWREAERERKREERTLNTLATLGYVVLYLLLVVVCVWFDGIT